MDTWHIFVFRFRYIYMSVTTVVFLLPVALIWFMLRNEWPYVREGISRGSLRAVWVMLRVYACRFHVVDSTCEDGARLPPRCYFDNDRGLIACVTAGDAIAANLTHGGTIRKANKKNNAPMKTI